MDGDDEFDEEQGGDRPARCPDDCANATAPYCPVHEDPSIYKRDENKLHLAEAYAQNAARDMIFRGVEKTREKRGLKEIRVPTRVMDEWLVFTKRVVLDSGEFTAQGEIERRIAQWLDKMKVQDWDRLDRIKERYMRFTPGWRGEGPPPTSQPAAVRPAAPSKREREAPMKRPSKRRNVDMSAAAEYLDDDG